MKTYITHERLGELACHLIGLRKPFDYDGVRIEFTASESFFKEFILEEAQLNIKDFEVYE